MLEDMDRTSTEELMEYIRKSPDAYHAAAAAAEELEANGFRRFEAKDLEKLEAGTKGYYLRNGSALAAFVTGQEPLQGGFRLMGAHTDSPALKIKPNAVVRSEGVLKLSTEIYGGPILNTWFDRPLSLAGRVAVRSSHAMNPDIRLIDFKDPLIVLPNVAIHMNRGVNEGVKIEAQKVMLPFLALAEELTRDPDAPAAAEVPAEEGQRRSDEVRTRQQETDYLSRLIASRLGVKAEDILDYDLYTYDVQPPVFVGANQEFINAPRLDNLAMSWAGLQGLIRAGVPEQGINLVILTDHEEVGSGSRQGAKSTFLRDLMELLVLAAGGSRAQFLQSFDRSFMISADLAHAVHPNYAEYADATNRPRINGGPVIKTSASMSYTSDADSAATLIALAGEAGVPWQRFVNRSDLRGGSTIGPVSAALVPVRSVDIGTAIWGMHSIRETGGSRDQLFVTRLLAKFFATQM